MMALSGVRSSWLMLARKADLTGWRIRRLPWPRAAGCSAFLRSVMSV